MSYIKLYNLHNYIYNNFIKRTAHHAGCQKTQYIKFNIEIHRIVKNYKIIVNKYTNKIAVRSKWMRHVLGRIN
jgi:hypothetical protein